jgi:EmrB/QacA subfamily drug resistance transporter
MDHKSINSNRPPYGILAILMIGAFITFLNNTLLNVALPSIMSDLQVDTATVQWLTTGFMLVNGIMIPTTAFLIQKYTVRRLFIVAMSLFSIGTVMAGIADGFPILLSARMVQASGSAIMMPLLMNVMLVSFPVAKRGAAMGMFGLILMFAPAIGPTLSGWIVEHYNWRMLFYFVAPISIGILVVGIFLLKDKKGKVDIRLDLFSLLLSSVGFGGLLYGFSSAGNRGWDSPHTYATIIIGAISLFWFIKRQLKLAQPMLNFTIFKFPMFSLSAAITMIINMALFSGFLLLPIYTQTVLGFSPMETGLMMLPGALLNAAMSPLTGKLFDRIGGRILAVTGLMITMIVTYAFSHLTTETSYLYLMLLHAGRMVGFSMIMMPIQTNGLNQLPARFYPHGTAMNNTFSQISGAIGTALLVTVMANREVSHAAQLTSEAMKVFGEQIPEEILHGIGMKAMVEGINFSFFMSSVLIFIALILAFFMKKATPAEDPFEEKEIQVSSQDDPLMTKVEDSAHR